MSSGTLGGTNLIADSGPLNWTGGYISGVVQFNGGNFSSSTLWLNGGQLINSGTVAWSANVYAGNGSVISNLPGATVNLAANNTAGTYIYWGGSHTFYNAGQVTVAGTGSATIADTFNNTGTVSVNGGTLTLSGGGTESGPFTVASGATLGLGGGSFTFNPGSTITGAGSLTVNANVNLGSSVQLSGAGTFTVSGGNVTVGGGLSLGGTWTFSGGTATLTGTATVTGNTINVSGGAVNFNGAGPWQPAAVNVSSGTLGGTNLIADSGPLNWTGGYISGVVQFSGGSFGSGPLYLNGGQLVNSGTVAWSALVYDGNGSVISNLPGATVNLAANNTAGTYIYWGGSHTFYNAGQVTVAGTGSATINDTFNNTGTVSVNGGTLNLTGGGTESGPFTVASGATLGLGGGSFTFNPGSTITGAGSLTVNANVNLGSSVQLSGAGTFTVSGGNVTVGGGLSLGGTWTVSGGTANLTGSASMNGNALVVSGGTANFNGSGTIAPSVVTMSSGGLGGTNLIADSGPLNWTGGTISGVVEFNGASFSSSPLYLSGGQLINSGTLAWSALVYDGTGSVISNLAGATINMAANNSAGTYGYYGGAHAFYNAGQLNAAGAGSATINDTFNNSGTVSVNSGNLVLSGGGTDSGGFAVASGATLNLGGGTCTINAGSTISGAGNFTVSGGTVTMGGTLSLTGTWTVSGGTANLTGSASMSGNTLVVSGGTANFNGSGTIAPSVVSMSSGGLGGTNLIADSGPLNWTGGTISGVVQFNGASFSSTPLYLSGGQLINSGTLAWSALVYDGNGSVISNRAGATINLAANNSAGTYGYYGGAHTFYNAGQLNAGGTGSATIADTFNNSGTVSVNSGTLNFSSILNNSGTLDVESGTMAVQSQYNGSGGVVNFALSGINTCGKMSFTSPLALASAGTLQAHTNSGYSPNPGDGFPLLTYPSATGNFTNFNLPPQAQWQTIVNPTNYIIVAIGSQPITNSFTWTGAVSLDWFNPNNWNPIGVPNGQAGQGITFSNGTINLSAPITINGQFNWLGGGLIGNPLTIATNGALSIGGTNVKYLQTALTNAGIAIWGGGNLVLSNCSTTAGSIVNSSGALWDIWCDQSMTSSCANTNAYWENMGIVVKSYGAGTNSVGVPFNSIGGTNEMLQGTLAFSAPAVFNGASLSGTGAVAFNGGLQNNQTLSVNGITLTLNGAWTNAGIINATSDVVNLGGNFTVASLGTLNSSGGIVNLTGVLTNTGTILTIGSSGGSWAVNGGTIDGGTVTTTNGAALLVGSSGGTLNGVTINGTLDVGNTYYSGSGVVLSVLNGLTLNGTAYVGCPTNSNFGAMSFVGSQTLAGNGSVVFGEAPNTAYNALRLANAGSTLTISPGITVHGQNGTIGYSGEYGGPQNVSVINQGTISGDVTPGTITIAARGYTQQGTLSVANSNVVNVASSLFLTGLGLFTIQPGGTIEVTGNVSGNTVNSGEFSALGTLTLNGSGTGSSPQFFEVMGQDFGSSPVGFIHNFTYGTVTLAHNTYVRLIDQYHNSSGTGSEALYINSLVVPSGTTLDLNGLHLYARAAQIGGSVLNGTVTQVPNSGPIGFSTPNLGNLTTAGELDQWTFFARAGQIYTVLVDPGSDIGVAPYLNYVQAQVVETNGTVIASATNASSGAPVLLSSIAITNDGTYGVQVHAPPGFPSSTGHYEVTVWQTTPNVGSVVLNQAVTGDIETPYSVDQWNFAATAGQQIRFHLVNTSGSGVGFNLTGPSGPLGFTNLTTDSSFITLPSSGNYCITAHSLSGQYGIVYAFQLLQTVQTNLTLGTAYQGQWAGSGQAVLLQFTVPIGAPMKVVLNNLVTNNHADIYVGLGQAPTPSSFMYSSTIPSKPNQQVIIPLAVAGTYYVLVYGDNIQTPGGFTVTVSSASVLLFSVTPNTTGINAPSTLTLSGAGFDGSSSVQFINGTSNYAATSISVDSFTQITATEAAGALPPGTYSIRVSLGSGSSATLTNALQVLAAGAPNLVTSLSLPGSLGYHVPATIYSQYGNTGDAAMPAPLVVLTATQNGIQAAYLTLDSTLVAVGLWTSAEPAGFSHSVQFLGSGQTPGVLQPGENFNFPTYYAGWQQPWNFSYPPVNWNLGVIQASDPTPLNWSSQEYSMEPPTIPADAWNAIWMSFTSQAGTTWGGYVTMLDNNAAYLGRLGLNVEDIGKLLAFQLMQADGLCPLRTLASSVDASVPTPGLPLTFSRSFGEPISRRYALGPLGRGWSHNWQYSLQQGSDGTITVIGPGGSQRVFQPDTRGGYFAQAGDYGTLAPVGGGGYTLTEKSGLAYYYQSNGQLGYVQDLNNNRITLAHTGSLLTSLTHSSGQSIHIAYNAASLIQTVTDQLGHQTALTYDAANQHLTGAQYFDGRTATYTYNTSGSPAQLHELTGVASSCCNWRYFSYDSFGRLVGTYLGGNAEALTLGYGSGGQVIVTDALGNVTQFYYDNRGLLARTVDGLGNAVHLSFDGNYNLVSVMDPAGRSYNYGYDSEGNVTSSTDPLANETQFTFTSAYNRLASLTDAKGNPTHYAYDPYGNLQTITYADGSVEGWSYDQFGNPETWNNRREHQTFYTFNNNAQVTGKYFADGSVTSYAYDGRGNLTNAATFDTELNPLESSGMTYDASNRLTRITYPGGKYLNFNYDSTGRRISSVDQLGHRLIYYYDVAGRLQSMTNELNALVVQYQYDAVGRVALKTLGNGMFTTYQYDPAGQLLGLTNSLANGTLLSSFDYTYDSRGRRTTMNTLDGNWTYTYDDIGQLTHAVYAAITTNVPSQDLAYLYDSTGNRTLTVENGVTNSYTANNLNQYFSVGQTNYTFDADGNLVKEVSPQGTITYTYNDENRLISMTSPQGNWQYTYDGLDNRTVVAANGTATRDVIDLIGFGNVVGEYDSAGNVIAHYDYGLGLITRTDSTGSTVGYAFDAMANAQQMITSAGGVANVYSYSPFGSILRRTETVPNPFQYVGQFGVMSEGTGMNFMRLRYFSTAMGLFSSRDPLNFYGGDLNPYRYAGNDPNDSTDPTGLLSFQVKLPVYGRRLLLDTRDFIAGELRDKLAHLGTIGPVFERTLGPFWSEVAGKAWWFVGYLFDADNLNNVNDDELMQQYELSRNRDDLPTGYDGMPGNGGKFPGAYDPTLPGFTPLPAAAAQPVSLTPETQIR